MVMAFLPRCGECAACKTEGLLPCTVGSKANASGTLIEGSMHLTSVEHGVMGSYAIIGAHLPIACGAATSGSVSMAILLGEPLD